MLPPDEFETVPPEEEAVIQSFIDRDKQAHDKAYPLGTTPVLRRLHAKTHGLVGAHFSVESNLPEKYRVGVFAKPHTYDAVVRCSNGARDDAHDLAADARGLSIKLFGVPGTKLLDDERDAATHDFTLLNHDVFLARTAVDFSDFINKVQRWGHPVFYIVSLFPPRLRLHEAKIISQSTKPIENPLAVRYWSQSPYRLGSLAVKYGLVPRLLAPEASVTIKSRNYLREVMVAQLASGGVEFDFLVQEQLDPKTMPIEDPTIRWDEARSPFTKVATLRIASQVFDTPARDAANEALSFTAWHALPEHRPLGGINRMRLHAYRSSQIVRHRRNEAPRIEPETLARALGESSSPGT
jgi:hypothetical protein